METKKEMTPAEKALSIIAKVVLVFGAIGSIATFFISCIVWDRYDGMDGINWIGVTSFIYIVMATLIGWSVLSVIAEISMNVRSEDNSVLDWKKEFAVLISTDQKSKARELLYREIFKSAQFKKMHGAREKNSDQALQNGVSEAYKEQQARDKAECRISCNKEMNAIYGDYLKAIGEESFKYDQTNDLYNVFM